MNVLAIDCSGDVLGVGVGRGVGASGRGPDAPKHPYREERGHGHAPGPGFVGVSIDAGFRHAERVMGTVEYCIREAGLEPADVDLIACSGGPGSFTGLRIGMATAKGLAMGLGKPFVAVPTLDAIAADWYGAAPVLVPVLDAKRSRFYFAVYENGKRVAGPFDDGLPRILELTAAYPEALFVGPDADMLEETAAERSGFRVVAERKRSPLSAMVRLAARIFEEEGPGDLDSGPLYLRPSDAEEAGLQRAAAGEREP